MKEEKVSFFELQRKLSTINVEKIIHGIKTFLNAIRKRAAGRNWDGINNCSWNIHSLCVVPVSLNGFNRPAMARDPSFFLFKFCSIEAGISDADDSLQQVPFVFDGTAATALSTPFWLFTSFLAISFFLFWNVHLVSEEKCGVSSAVPKSWKGFPNYSFVSASFKHRHVLFFIRQIFKYFMIDRISLYVRKVVLWWTSSWYDEFGLILKVSLSYLG